jgi:transcriptional regulator with XRE-family HTH domain
MLYQEYAVKRNIPFAEMTDRFGVMGLSAIRPTHYTASVATFGENLRRLREARTPELRQEALAEMLGHTNNSQVSKWETSGLLPRPDTVEKVAAVMGVEPAALMADVPDPYDRLRGLRYDSSDTTENSAQMTSSVTGSVVKHRASKPYASSPEALVAESAAVPSPNPEAVTVARKLYRHAASLSDLAERLMHGFSAGRRPAPATRSRRTSSATGGSHGHAHRGRKR